MGQVLASISIFLFDGFVAGALKSTEIWRKIAENLAIIRHSYRAFELFIKKILYLKEYFHGSRFLHSYVCYRTDSLEQI